MRVSVPEGKAKAQRGEEERACVCVLALLELLDDAAGDSERDKNEIRWGENVNANRCTRPCPGDTRGLLAHGAAHGFI